MFSVHKYAEDVVAGRVLTGKPARWACERHLRDLETGRERGFYFDDEKASEFLRFARLQKHTKGKWAGQYFVPEPFQEFFLGSLQGWRRIGSGLRRYREVWVQTAKKQGKSFLEAIIANWMLAFDGEEAPYIVSAATKAKQARVVFEAAQEMVQKNSDLAEFITIYKHSLWSRGNNGVFIPLTRARRGEDGPSISCGLLDEVHEWPDGFMWKIVHSGMVAREQPLLIAATTAGFNMYGFAKEKYDYYRSIVDPRSGIENEYAFVFIAEMDEGDDWKDEGVWIKSNPCMDVTVPRETLREKFQTALASTSEENNFKVKHLNMWVGQAERWLRIEDWDQCGGEEHFA